MKGPKEKQKQWQKQWQWQIYLRYGTIRYCPSDTGESRWGRTMMATSNEHNQSSRSREQLSHHQWD